MHTTSLWRTVSRVALVLGLFFTGCCFLDSWHRPFFFNYRYQGLKLFLSVLLPAALLLFNFLAERSLRFAGYVCAGIMNLSLVLYFADRWTVNLIARLDKGRINIHFLYTLISLFTVLAVGWLCARCSKKTVDFAVFYRRFSLGYLPLCVFLFIMEFFVLRTFGNDMVNTNALPFHGEIYYLYHFIRNGNLTFTVALRSAGNVLYFTSVALALCGTLRRRPMVWGTAVPVVLSVFVESFQYVTRCGDADIDDVILNTLGALLGVLIYRLLLQPLLQKEKTVC